MALQSYEVAYSTDGGTTNTVLSDVQNITVNIGRKRQLDQYSASTASFTLRYPTGYASPVTALVSGTLIRIKNNTTGKVIFWGKIADVQAKYGIPYAGGVGNADFLDVSVESIFATAGRASGNSYVMAAGSIVTQLATATIQSGVTFSATDSTKAQTQIASTTVSSTWADWFSRVLLTTNARMYDCVDPVNVSYVSPFSSQTSAINFSDTTNNATNQVYDQVQFGSYSDNYYTQTSVAPESYSVQTVTQTGAATPYRTYQVNTLNSSAAQATDYANYLLGNYGTPRFAPTSISCVSEAQSSFKLDQIGVANLIMQSPGMLVSVLFRGTSYKCVVEGVTISATPSGSRYTYYLSGADLNAYLLLGDSIFGRLDYNKLGY